MNNQHSQQHDDFLEGFSDSTGINDPSELEQAYKNWIRHRGLSEIEKIDFESGGYEAGLEAGSDYKGTL
jgi:hypothetical protein